MKKLLLSVVLLAMAAPALADPRHLLATSGDWKLYRDESYDIAWKDGKHYILTNACVAETVQAGDTVDLIALPPTGAQSDPTLVGQLILRVKHVGGGYGQHKDQVWLEMLNHKYNLGKALYNGDWITGFLGAWADQANPFSRAAAVWGEELTFKTRTGTELASVRAGGLNAIYPKLLDCGLGK